MILLMSCECDCVNLEGYLNVAASLYCFRAVNQWRLLLYDDVSAICLIQIFANYSG